MASFGANAEGKAQEYIANGEKCLTKWSLFKSTTKNEDAAEWFDKAAKSFKVARKMETAAETFMRAAEQFEIVKSAHEAARAYVEAAKCRKEVDPGSAIDPYSKAIEIYNDAGRFQQAGKMLMEVGEIHEANKEYDSAISAMDQAAQYLQGEGSTSQANACLVKVAGMFSKDMDPPKLGDAAKLYGRLGSSCMEKKLLAMNAKGYWLQAGLCLLAQGDTVAARNKMDEFLTKDHTFEGSRECRFYEQLIKTVEDLDEDSFSQTCFDYDQISKLDPWKTTMCLRIKRAIESEADGPKEDADDIDLT